MEALRIIATTTGLLLVGYHAIVGAVSRVWFELIGPIVGGVLRLIF